MSADDKDEEMIAALTIDEHKALRAGLEALPETMPPRVVWDRIRQQAEAEGLISRRPARSWYIPSGLAATLVATAIILTWPADDPVPPVTSMTVPDSLPSNSQDVAALQALMVESRQLEENLRSLPAEPRVMRAGTAAMIAEIEDRVAAIDQQLSDPDAGLTADEETIFWRERVRLMKSLLGLRYAQAQRNAL